MSEVFVEKDRAWHSIGQPTALDFSFLQPVIDEATQSIKDFADACGKITIKLDGDFRPLFEIVKIIEQRYERLRRQHKAKARGRNWRNVR